ncbi:hypothetical protein LI328DRAFT_158372 [Trichoderma asperelloides]|nr:hypothetical protein LI328DRAFT_158372 [Trichoderma asperelloides]
MDQDSDYSYEEQEAAAISSSRTKMKEVSKILADTELSTGYEDELEQAGSNESDYVGEDEEGSFSSAAESESQELRSQLKRPLDDTEPIYRPFKRQRGELNLEYLELLNNEIQDAAQQSSFGNLKALSASHIGLTHWSTAEKQKFFEAVARLGKYNLPGIATKVGSKSVAEVSHYLEFLQEACEARRQQQGSRTILELVEYPAALEISQQCCRAEEEAADEISLKQEAREEIRERNRWGDVWDITPKVARKLSKAIHKQDENLASIPQFAQLFHSSTWLELSARMFMNSSVPGNNWNSIGGEPPSMWATTFEDFHSLALSITRRLVQTTIFIAMSRIRSKNATRKRVRDMVQLQDVEAAISSLNLTSKLNESWVSSARRLRLDVYENLPEGDEEFDEEHMTYEEIERALSGDNTVAPGEQAQPDTPFSTQLSDVEDEDDNLSDAPSESSRSPSPTNEEERQIDMEAVEVLEYSVMGIRSNNATRKALKAFIATDRQLERQAEEIDQYASYKAEIEMWNLLQKKPPMELPKKHDPGPVRRSNLSLDSFYPSGRDWAHKLAYYSEWETLPLSEPELKPGSTEEEVVIKGEAGDEGGDEAEEEDREEAEAERNEAESEEEEEEEEEESIDTEQE